MSFLHLSLLAGLGAITVPIMLHLFGRSQPQLVDFPALRFVTQTTQEQSLNWRLRHLLLLMLRILLLAALALALARPRVHTAMLGSVLTISAVAICATLAAIVAVVAFASRRPMGVWLTSGVISIALWLAGAFWGLHSLTAGPSVPNADQSAPVAAALIIDNGPTMQYRANNALRLNAAKEMALWILDQLPVESRVGILSEAPIGSLALDPSTAESQVKIIEGRGARVDLLSRTRTALELVLANELERKEIYVITDLTSASWSSAQPELAKLLDENSEEVLLQVIDVGSEDVANFRLGDPLPDFETVPAGGDITVDISLHGSPATARETLTVELIQEQIDPRLPVISDGKLQLPAQKIADRQVVELAENESANINLTARSLAPGTHNFTIRFDKPDPLAIDNERYVSVLAQSQKPTLIVANDSAIALDLQAVVDPQAIDPATAGETQVDQVRYVVQLSNLPLEKYAVICLFDPTPMTSRTVQALNEHVQGGGGLFIILGKGLGPFESIQGNPITELLPGVLSGIASRTASQGSIFPEPVALSHPVFAELGESPDQVLWHLYPVYRNWTFSSLADDAQTLMKLSDGSAPFLIAQNRGRGQILTLTTPIPEVESRDGDLWNLLWVNEPIPAFALLLGSFRTLSGVNQEQLNYEVGQPVNLFNDPLVWPSRYELYTPQAQLRRVDALDGSLNLGEFERAGIYRLRGQRDGLASRAFSVNVPSSDTLLQRMTAADLDDRLGGGNYNVASDQSQVESSVGRARFGRELYPMLMVLVAGLFLAEQAMSNRFYKIKLGGARK